MCMLFWAIRKMKMSTNSSSQVRWQQLQVSYLGVCNTKRGSEIFLEAPVRLMWMSEWLRRGLGLSELWTAVSTAIPVFVGYIIPLYQYLLAQLCPQKSLATSCCFYALPGIECSRQRSKCTSASFKADLLHSRMNMPRSFLLIILDLDPRYSEFEMDHDKIGQLWVICAFFAIASFSNWLTKKVGRTAKFTTRGHGIEPMCKPRGFRKCKHIKCAAIYNIVK
jgi:hypothetical protein